MYFDGDQRGIGILETFNPEEGKREFRVAVLEQSDEYVGKDISVPITQARFIVTFNSSPAFSEYEDAYKYADDLMYMKGMHPILNFVISLDHSKHDYKMFMGLEFAKKLLEKDKRKKPTFGKKK